MKNKKLKNFLFTCFLLILFPGMIIAGENDTDGGSAHNGGDDCERQIKNIQIDLAQWISSGGVRDVNLPRGLTSDKYNESMLNLMSTAQVSCTSDKIFVNGVEKTCENLTSPGKTPIMRCNTARFFETKLNSQYILIHHEYAGLSGFETNKGADSDYTISNQLQSLLDDKIISLGRYLNICSRGAVGNLIANHLGAKNCKKVSRKKMANIKKLDFSKKEIPFIPSRAFWGLSSIEELDLTSTNIKAIADNVFKDCKNLRDLKLPFWEVEELTENTFNGLVLLESLNLYTHKGFSKISPYTFTKLKKLKKVDIKYNPKTSDEKFPIELLKGLANLEELVLSSSNINFIDGDMIKGLHRLKKLSLHMDLLQKLPANLLQDSSELEEFSLSKCKVNMIDTKTFSYTPSLKELSLRTTQIKYIKKDTFKGLTKLEKLDLSDNDIHFIEDNSFIDLSSLHAIRFDNNSIASITSETFNGLGKVTDFWMNNNKLFVLPKNSFSALVSVKRLLIESNQINEIEDKVFTGANQLIELNLGSNEIESLSSEMLEGLTNLEKLFLGFNSSLVIEKNTFLDLQNLKKINLDYIYMKQVSRDWLGLGPTVKVSGVEVLP